MESRDFRRVGITSPPAPWIGGKRRLAARIAERLAAIPHRCYAEPFVGMGGVFFRRQSRPTSEVINDVNRELINLFRILQCHYVPFVEMLRWQLSSRAELERLQSLPAERLTDLQRAARFLYLQRTAFGGIVDGQTFGVSSTCGSRFDINKVGPLLEELHDRLAGVVIECLPYGDFIDRYDGPDTLFYLDPPYNGSETDYGKGIFGRENFADLAERLKRLKGRFLLSINDTPAMRNAFSSFDINQVETTYSVSRGSQKRMRELIISQKA